MTGLAENWTDGVVCTSLLPESENLFTLAVAIDRGQTGQMLIEGEKHVSA
jgi:hypothetical protein